jgi:hypothetical protein
VSEARGQLLRCRGIDFSCEARPLSDLLKLLWRLTTPPSCFLVWVKAKVPDATPAQGALVQAWYGIGRN